MAHSCAKGVFMKFFHFFILMLLFVVTTSYSFMAVVTGDSRVYEIRQGDRWYDITPECSVYYLSYRYNGDLVALPWKGEYLYIREPNDEFWQRITGPGSVNDTWFRDMCAQGDYIYVLSSDYKIYQFCQGTWFQVAQVQGAHAIAGAQSPSYYNFFVVCRNSHEVYGFYSGGQNQLASLPQSSQSWGSDITYDSGENILMASNVDNVWCYDFGDDEWYTNFAYASEIVDNSPKGTIFSVYNTRIYMCTPLSCSPTCRRVSGGGKFIRDFAIKY